MSQPLTTAAKLTTAREKKNAADQAFKAGDYKGALQSYHLSLMYLVGLDKNALQSLTGQDAPPAPRDINAPPSEEKTEADELIEKIYANMSACHLHQGKWERAVETADKALKKNENNHKALFRKGRALGEWGFFEKAETVLEDLKKKNPADAAEVDKELARLRAIDKARSKANDQKLRRFLIDKKPKPA